ncbi:MAG: zf-HC2 domain-containing protein [Acidobacteriota bacterium]
MNCDQVRLLFWEHRSQSLAAREREQITAHLRSCSSCSEHFQALEQVDAELDRLPSIEPSSYFDQRVNARLSELLEPLRGWERIIGFLTQRSVVTFAVLLVVTLGTWLFFRSQQEQRMNSLDEVVEMQNRSLEKYQGKTPAPEKDVLPKQLAENGPVQSRPSPSNPEAFIPESDLAVVENLDFLENYDLIKQFEADAASAEMLDSRRN